MASEAAQMVCMTLGVIGLIGVITCCALPQWKVTIFKAVNSEQVLYEGLWKGCMTYSTGKLVIYEGLWKISLKEATGELQCRVYDSMLELSSDLEAGQPMTVISCILCGLSLLILFFGADFTPCVQNQGTKLKLLLILVAAVGLLLAGLLVIIPVSWSAHTIRDFYNPVLQETELGASIYIGWAAGVLLILAGVLLCCFGRPRSSSSGGTARYFSNRASGPNHYAI